MKNRPEGTIDGSLLVCTMCQIQGLINTSTKVLSTECIWKMCIYLKQGSQCVLHRWKDDSIVRQIPKVHKF